MTLWCEVKSIFWVDCKVIIDANVTSIKSESNSAINDCVAIKIEICWFSFFDASAILSFVLTDGWEGK